MAKFRSPNYPVISLPEAIEKARSINEKESIHPADPEVIARAMGYNSLNGSSVSVTSALKKYGLLETVENGQLKLTSEAFELIEFPRGSEERADALQRINDMVPLFAELNEMYPDSLPSDENLRVTLLKKGFNPKITHEVITNYRETREFINAELSEYNRIKQSNKASSLIGWPTHTMQTADIFKTEPKAQKDQLVRSITIPLSFPRNVTAQINIYGGNFKPEDLAYLKRTIGEWEEQFKAEAKEDKSE